MPIARLIRIYQCPKCSAFKIMLNQSDFLGILPTCKRCNGEKMSIKY